MSGPERLAPPELDRLADAVCGMDRTAEAGGGEVARAVYRLLGAGQPVDASRLAAALGWDEARSGEALARLPNTEVDDDGAVIGFGGLTLRGSPHRVVVGGVGGAVRHTWCAWDTLFLPVALGVPVSVSSQCLRTGRAVTLEVAPTGIVARDPDTAVVSFLRPEAVDPDDLRGSFCGEVHFLADAEAAASWAAEGGDRLVLDLDDAFELGRRMIVERCGPLRDGVSAVTPEPELGGRVALDDMTPDDWPAVRAIYEEGIATGNATFDTAAPSWEDWDAAHLPTPRLVARDAGRVLGWAALSPVSGRCVYTGVAEVSVYVAAAARGRGVGRSLLTELIAQAEQAGIWTLEAGVFPENTASLALHHACGFRTVGTRERFGQHHGRWRDVLLLERRMAANPPG